VNKSEYARHRGVSVKQVHRAIRLGWITLAEPDGSIDAKKADKSWAAAADPAHPRGKAARSSGSYLDARLAAQLSANALRRATLDKERRALVNAARAVAAVQPIADRARASWLPWAERIAADFARDIGATDVDQVRRVLTRHVADHLASLPPLKIELG
jgi:hypothetical protein